MTPERALELLTLLIVAGSYDNDNDTKEIEYKNKIYNLTKMKNRMNTLMEEFLRLYVITKDSKE